jgi:BlaI family penicillinase repressor
MSIDEISDTEMEIMLVVWEQGNPSVRDIVQAVYSQHSQTLHTTVKSLLERLSKKGFVECDRSDHVHRFRARIEREAFVQSRVGKLADSVYSGNVAPVLLSMVEKVRLSKKDRETIEEILSKLK